MQIGVYRMNNQPEIELTLNPVGAAAAQSAPAASAPTPTEETAVPVLDESAFTEAERKMISDFSEKIDITDSAARSSRLDAFI